MIRMKYTAPCNNFFFPKVQLTITLNMLPVKIIKKKKQEHANDSKNKKKKKKTNGENLRRRQRRPLIRIGKIPKEWYHALSRPSDRSRLCSSWIKTISQFNDSNHQMFLNPNTLLSQFLRVTNSSFLLSQKLLQKAAVMYVYFLNGVKPYLLSSKPPESVRSVIINPNHHYDVTPIVRFKSTFPHIGP